MSDPLTSNPPLPSSAELVARLRRQIKYDGGTRILHPECQEAADTISTLEERVSELGQTVERLAKQLEAEQRATGPWVEKDKYDRLRAALKKYGEHIEPCMRWRLVGKAAEGCTCGLSAALAGAGDDHERR